MSSGADLFVVCKHCGSEVSPYITECPYCGHRLRRRAPELPREKVARRPARGLARLLARGGSGRRGRPLLETKRRSRFVGQGGFGTRPYATMALVTAGCGAWIALHARGSLYGEMTVIGPVHGDWWKLLSTQFSYVSGWYALFALAAIAIFGWLLEGRHGPVIVVALFLGAGVTGALVAGAVYSVPVVGGGNAGALALLAAWAAPDLRAARARQYYEGDLLGVAAIAATLLAIPFAIATPEASWLAGVTGGALGLLVGAGLHSLDAAER
jgi:membrane associated rhomboid family serine protease